MANRIKELKTRALEISKATSELEGQKRINMRDLSINGELRGIGFEDERDRAEVESVSKAVTGEQVLINGRIGDNRKEINRTVGEADNYINSLKGNLRKMERMEKASDLAADVGGQKADTKGKIDELEDIKRMLKPDNCEVSSISKIMKSTVSNIDSPGILAQIAGECAPPGAESAVAQVVQMAVDTVKTAFPIFVENVAKTFPSNYMNQCRIVTCDKNGKVIRDTALETNN